MANEPIIIFDIPLLYEAKLTYLCNEIWVVYCSQEEQIKRIISRDKVSQDEAKIKINAQLDLSKKMQLADVIIKNDGKIESWKAKINDLLR